MPPDPLSQPYERNGPFNMGSISCKGAAPSARITVSAPSRAARGILSSTPYPPHPLKYPAGWPDASPQPAGAASQNTAVHTKTWSGAQRLHKVEESSPQPPQ